MARFSLRSRIVFSAGLVILIATATIVATATLLYLSHHVETLQSRSTAVARGLVVQIERITNLGIAIEDIVGFEEQCREAVRAYPGTHYAQVVRPDGNVSFLRSYPNLIPLSPQAIGQIVAGFDAFDYDRLYDNFAGRLAAGAANIVHFSADRYVAWITGAHDDLV